MATVLPERVAAPAMFGRGLDRAEHTVCGDRGWIARASRETGDVLGLHVDEVHVARARAHVFGGHVASAQAFDEASVRAKEHLAIGGAVVANDDGLAAAEVEAGHG